MKQPRKKNLSREAMQPISPKWAAQASRRLHAYLDALAASPKLVGDDGRLYDVYPVGLTPERAGLLAEVCRSARPRATLEVGMALGVSTLTILEALLEGGPMASRHVVIDPFQQSQWRNAARRSLRLLGVEELVEFYEESSLAVLPRMVGEGRRFDLIFVDGNHRFDYAFVDFRFAHELLTAGGVVVLDDTWLDALHLTVRYAETNLGYTICAAAGRTMGRPAILALRKPAEEPRRGCSHFESCGCQDFVPFFDGPDAVVPVPSEEADLGRRADGMAGVECAEA